MSTAEPVDPDGRPEPDLDVLNRWLWSALTTHHAHLAEVKGLVRRYRPDVAMFSAFDPAVDDQDPAAWADLAALVGPGGSAIQTSVRPEVDPPAGWTTLFGAAGVQMVLTEPDRLPARSAGEPSSSARTTRDLGEPDVAAMVELVRLTEPGPFEARTIEMGRYVGTFDGDRLVAMAGERIHPTGFTEISAVCTHPAARGQGLAAALVGIVAGGILERGETPFLNVREDNPARALYERLGFSDHLTFRFRVVQRGGS
jgi:ribosomal protein S18 acetylase RimI-like enzyme